MTTHYLSFERRHSAGFFLRAHEQDAPDTSGQNAVAASSVALSADQLAWAKQVYAEQAPARDAAATRANALSDAQLAATQQQTQIAANAENQYTTTFQPLENQMASDAAGYDTPERRQAAAAAAAGGIESQVSAQRDASERALARQGVDPSSGKALGLAGAQNIAAAAAKAGAATQAERNVETVGAAKVADAVNLGRGIASSQATSAQLALAQGNSSVANSTTGLADTASGTGLVSGGYSGALSGLATAGSIYGSVANEQAAANSANSSIFGGLGSVVGQYAGSTSGSKAITSLISDKNQKRGRKPASTKSSLKGLRDLKVEKWQYKPGSAADDGGRDHVGPMAQDVQRGLGDAAAPGGTTLDPVSLHGHTIAAIQELAKGQEKLAGQVKGLASARRPAPSRAAAH